MIRNNLDNVFVRYRAIVTGSKKDVQFGPERNCELNIGCMKCAVSSICSLGLASSSLAKEMMPHEIKLRLMLLLKPPERGLNR